MTNFDLNKIVQKDTEIAELDVWLGNKNYVKAYISQDVYKTIPKARKRYLKAIIDYNGPIAAPIKKNDILGYKFHNFIHTVSQGSGIISIKETLLKAGSQIVSLGFGGSVGQEGPMAQLGGSIGSVIGQKIRIKKSDLKIPFRYLLHALLDMQCRYVIVLLYSLLYTLTDILTGYRISRPAG